MDIRQHTGALLGNSNKLNTKVSDIPFNICDPIPPSVHFLLVPLHLGFKPVEAVLKLAQDGVFQLVGQLFLLPLHRVLPSLVRVHIPRVDGIPPDVKLVLAQLALDTPLGVGATWYLTLTSDHASGPGAGVAKVQVDTLDVCLPVKKQAKAFVTMFTPEWSDLGQQSVTEAWTNPSPWNIEYFGILS